MILSDLYSQTDEINKGSNLGNFRMGAEIQNEYLPSVSADGAMPIEVTENEDGTNAIKGYYNHFDYAYRLTMLILYSDSYDLFGIRVGDSVMGAETILEGVGYYPVEPQYESPGTDYTYFAKGFVTLIFSTEKNSDVIVSIQIGMDYPGWDNIDGAS